MGAIIRAPIGPVFHHSAHHRDQSFQSFQSFQYSSSLAFIYRDFFFLIFCTFVFQFYPEVACYMCICAFSIPDYFYKIYLFLEQKQITIEELLLVAEQIKLEEKKTGI